MSAPSPLPREQAAQRSQELLAALLADYGFQGAAGLTSAALIRILAEFGVSESGARSALTRATQRGLLAATRDGAGRLRYALGEWGMRVHGERLSRVLGFGATRTEGDDDWTVAVLPAPVGDRAERRRLRQRLEAAGYGGLSDGVWIHPRAEPHAVRELLADTGLPVIAFRGPLLAEGVAPADAYDLPALRAVYERFLAEYEPHRAIAQRAESSGAEALRVRTSVLRDWRRIGLEDPDLPASVLPDDWPQARARAVFLELRDDLAPAALRHLGALVGPEVSVHAKDAPRTPAG
jgi:phenylacetic acid degradation operon negative regulatory protein